MALKHVILTILESEPATGYDITRTFDEAVGHFWHASHQQVYAELKKMLREELVVMHLEPQQGKPDRKVYEIVDKGREALAAWVMEPVAERTKSEVLVKLLVTEAVGPEQLLQELERLEAEYSEKLQIFRQIEAQEFSPEKLQQMPVKCRRLYMTLRYGLRAKQGCLEWIRECREMLEKEIKE